MQEKASKRGPASVAQCLGSSGVGNEECWLVLAPGTSLVLLHGMRCINSTRSQEQSSGLAPPGSSASSYSLVRDFFRGLSLYAEGSGFSRKGREGSALSPPRT